MRLYLAPMEGITTYVYRNALEKHYGNIDKYFTPFLTASHIKGTGASGSSSGQQYGDKCGSTDTY